MYTLLSYLLICAVCINMINNEKSVRYLMLSLSISTAIICIIGLFQLLGYDLFKSEFGLKLIIPSKYHEAILDSVNFKFDRTYSTLQNPNYVGSFMSMTAMLSLTYLIFNKGMRSKIIAAAILVLSLTNLFGSMSRAGMVGMAASMVLLLILAGKQNFKSRVIVIGGIAVIVAVFIGVDSIFDGVMLNRCEINGSI
jgi:O-antigen ligase